MSDEQTPAERFREAMRKAFANSGQDISAAARNASNIFVVQGAMGWLFRGDLEQARIALQRLPRERLIEVSTAAAALSSLADEVAADG